MPWRAISARYFRLISFWNRTAHAGWRTALVCKFRSPKSRVGAMIERKHEKCGGPESLRRERREWGYRAALAPPGSRRLAPLSRRLAPKVAPSNRAVAPGAYRAPGRRESGKPRSCPTSLEVDHHVVFDGDPLGGNEVGFSFPKGPIPRIPLGVGFAIGWSLDQPSPQALKFPAG